MNRYFVQPRCVGAAVQTATKCFLPWTDTSWQNESQNSNIHTFLFIFDITKYKSHTVGGRYQQTHCYILETVTYRALQFLHQEENKPDLDTLIRASKHQINLFNLHQLEKLHGVLSFKADVFSRGKTKQNKTKMLIHTGGIVEQEGVVGRQCSQIMALAL